MRSHSKPYDVILRSKATKNLTYCIVRFFLICKINRNNAILANAKSFQALRCHSEEQSDEESHRLVMPPKSHHNRNTSTYRTEKRNTVIDSKLSPGFKTVDGKSL